MAAPARYPVPAAEHRAEASIQRSRFVATLAPAPTVEDAHAFVKRVAAGFSDATHNCWAFVVGPPGSTGRVGMSDAGEPHGTAGRPMLTALLHSGVGDVAAVVTRWYGGTKLGTGGLVRAYGGMVQDALASLPRAERIEMAEVALAVDYPHVALIRQLLPAYEAELVGEDYGERAALRVRLPAGRAQELVARVRDGTRGAVEVGE